MSADLTETREDWARQNARDEAAEKRAACLEQLQAAARLDAFDNDWSERLAAVAEFLDGLDDEAVAELRGEATGFLEKVRDLDHAEYEERMEWMASEPRRLPRQLS